MLELRHLQAGTYLQAADRATQYLHADPKAAALQAAITDLHHQEAVLAVLQDQVVVDPIQEEVVLQDLHQGVDHHQVVHQADHQAVPEPEDKLY